MRNSKKMGKEIEIMISKVVLRGHIERKIADRNNMVKIGKVWFHHFGDFGTKKTANEYANAIRELSKADIEFGQRGFLARVSDPYYSHINPALKYGVYIARRKKKSE